jgi:hypothetical protein
MGGYETTERIQGVVKAVGHWTGANSNANSIQSVPAEPDLGELDTEGVVLDPGNPARLHPDSFLVPMLVIAGYRC